MTQTRAQWRRGDAPAWHSDPWFGAMACVGATGLGGALGLLGVLLAGLHAAVVPAATTAAIALVVGAMLVGRYRGGRHV